MSDTFLSWLGIPKMPLNNYLAHSVSGLPINVPAIAHESGENQNPLRSLCLSLKNTCRNVPTSIQKTSPPTFLNCENTWPDRISTSQDYVSQNIRIYIYYQVVWETTFYVKKFQICFKIEKKNIGHFIWRPKYALLLLATFNHHRSSLFEWMVIRL
jgi:hypothetical protein